MVMPPSPAFCSPGPSAPPSPLEQIFPPGVPGTTWDWWRGLEVPQSTRTERAVNSSSQNGEHPRRWALGVGRSGISCTALENVPFAFQVARAQGLAAPGPGRVPSWGQEGQECGSPQGAGHSKARILLAQLKSSFIRQLPKQGLFTGKSHPRRVGGTEVGGCPSLFSVLVPPKCPPSSTVSPSLLSVPPASQIPRSSTASSSSP